MGVDERWFAATTTSEKGSMTLMMNESSGDGEVVRLTLLPCFAHNTHASMLAYLLLCLYLLTIGILRLLHYTPARVFFLCILIMWIGESW